MYKLYYETMTNKYFIQDETKVKTGLVILKNKLLIPGESFTLKEYLEALGLKPTIPRHMNKRYTKSDFHYMNVFSYGGGYVYGTPVIMVKICSQK